MLSQRRKRFVGRSALESHAVINQMQLEKLNILYNYLQRINYHDLVNHINRTIH